MSASSPVDSNYPTVMNSIAGRLTASHRSLMQIEQHPTSSTNWMNLDFVTLQIRKICELFLLGSVLAHIGEGDANLDIRKWRPKDSFAELKKLSEHSLPLPLERDIKSHASGANQLNPASKPLPFGVLQSIYGHCGDLLHVPSAYKVLHERITPFDVSKFRRWVIGFSNLLAGHALLLPALNRILICTWDGSSGSDPDVILLEARGPSTINISLLPEFEMLQP